MSHIAKAPAMDVLLAMRFGEVLRERRMALGLSQDTLAFNADLHRTYISLLERGIRQPSLETIFTLAREINWEPDELIRQVQERY